MSVPKIIIKSASKKNYYCFSKATKIFTEMIFFLKVVPIFFFFFTVIVSEENSSCQLNRLEDQCYA